MMQNILFPMRVMNITTKAGEGTHVGSNAIDVAGSNPGIESAFAPFTGVVRKVWPNGNTVWLESVEPVQFADGRQDYAVVSLTHDNSVTDLPVGRRIEQGEEFYQEGTAGNATGNHIHLEIGVGRFTGTGWHQIANGNWVINNSYPATSAFFLDGTTVLNGGGYEWKTLTGDDDMITKDDADLLRIINSEVKGYPFDETHAGQFDNQELNGWVGRSWRQLVREGWAASGGFRDIRKGAFDFTRKFQPIIAELEARPKEVVVEKPVEVIREVIKEVPVDRIVEKEVIKEVNVSDADRTAGELLLAGFKKLFGAK
ncbi:hypothetical protein [Rathayibacter festucae]|uniref:hypothetical protein n=1 Tax=Rathayibacter festucae TaxID=110937 RepID=UPI001ABFE2BC|nr:hypothetical protein [Rathayibacter festucae]